MSAEISRLSAALFYGGGATRFGADKGLAEFRGQPLASWALSALERISDDVWISSHDESLAARLGHPVVKDIHPGNGPLGGLHASLKAARHDLLAVAACDMPFASVALFLHMQAVAAGWDAVVPASPRQGAGTSDRCAAVEDCYCEPLHALYRRSCLPAVESALARGDRKLDLLLAAVKTRLILPAEREQLAGVHPLAFENVNTREDLARLEAAENA